MQTDKTTPTWGAILIALLVFSAGWALWGAWERSRTAGALKQFEIRVLHTNAVSGVGVFERRTGQPIWTRFGENGKPVIENHFFRGEDVFDVTLRSNAPPVFNVYFRGPGRSVTWWLNAGGANTFTERIVYDTNGDFCSREVWYRGAWRPVDTRDGRNGIVQDGQWHHLGFDTNGMWTTAGP